MQKSELRVQKSECGRLLARGWLFHFQHDDDRAFGGFEFEPELIADRFDQWG